MFAMPIVQNCLNTSENIKKSMGEELEFKWSILKSVYACNEALKLCKLCTIKVNIYLIIWHQIEPCD